jgi:NAD(P)H dehydrogenase (quinone)
LTDILGRPVTVSIVTPEEQADFLAISGLPKALISYAVGIDIEAGHLAETTETLARLIGRPATPLATGLRATLS